MGVDDVGEPIDVGLSPRGIFLVTSVSALVICLSAATLSFSKFVTSNKEWVVRKKHVRWEPTWVDILLKASDSFLSSYKIVGQEVMVTIRANEVSWNTAVNLNW